MTTYAPAARTASTRRRRLRLALGALLLLAVAACGSGGEDDAAAGEGEAYSVTVTTPDDGEQTLDVEPRRIAATNGNRVIPFLLPFLDEEHRLVGYGNDPEPANFPWIQEELESLPNSPDLDGPDLETYASWRPDLLLANGNVGDAYDPVREVGPVVSLPETDWRATTELLGQIFEKPEVAEQVIADTEEVIAGARRETPVSAVVFSPYQDNGTVGTQVLGSELANFLAELNVEVAPSETAEDGYEDVSLELLGEKFADVDWVIVFYNSDELEQSFLANPLVQQLPAVAEGRLIVLDAVQSGAGFPVTPPSIPAVLDGVAPLLEE